MSNFLNSLNIVGSALTAQRFRMDVVTQNLTAKDTISSTEEGAYKRKLVVFEERPLTFDDILTNTKNGGVIATRLVESTADVKSVYDPTNPLCDENGYIYYSNVDSLEEQADLMAASRSYDANVTALNIVKAMAMKGLQIGQ